MPLVSAIATKTQLGTPAEKSYPQGHDFFRQFLDTPPRGEQGGD